MGNRNIAIVFVWILWWFVLKAIIVPVGGFLGTYSMASMTEVRVKDPVVCVKHKDKCCYTGGSGG